MIGYKPSNYYHVNDNFNKVSEEPKIQIYGRAPINLDPFRLQKTKINYLKLNIPPNSLNKNR